MEIKKELPEVFKEFAEARQNAFLAAKELKEKDIPLIGIFCTYFPMELAMAMGAAVVGLCATSDETIPEAEKDLPGNLCPLVKSSYGFAKTDKCPFFYFSDLVVGETTCDAKKKMYELLGEFKPVHVMQLPNTQDEDGYKLWKKEVIKAKKVLEEKFGVEISDEKLRKAIKIRNEERKAVRALFELMKNDPVPMMGYDLFKIAYGSTFKFDVEKVIEEIKFITEKVKKEYAEEQKIPHKPRILITGCPIGGATEKVIKVIEENGAVVVGYENCVGFKQYDRLIDEEKDDLYDAIAERYFKIGCSVMSPDKYRYELLYRIMDEYKVDGVVEVILQACHTYNVESFGIKRVVSETKKTPYIAVETDYSQSDIGQLSTRLTAFIEML
ncbi:MAG: double-cubane-cluster-containing anaerobic reductase [Desulfotomaculaceae bacterium]|nr:double-cubane-cluster-containing anaerobic reductase [Desulfotomaculaceae bacterium]